VKLLNAQDIFRTHLSLLGHTLDDLDELGEIMQEMLRMQDEVQVSITEFPSYDLSLTPQ
jgi:hypothetical protein